MPEFYKIPEPDKIQRLYRMLSRDELAGLGLYEQVFITSKDRDLYRTKALVLYKTTDDTTNLQVCTDKIFTVSLSNANDGEYGTDWYAEVLNGITVQTPLGLLVAHVIQDETHPGIEIDMYPGAQKLGLDSNGMPVLPEKEPMTLVLTEFAEFESLCSFMPDEPSLMLRELKEVPRRHVVHVDGTPLGPGEIPTVQTASKYRVKPTILTRAWPDASDEDEAYSRIFHET